MIRRPVIPDRGVVHAPFVPHLEIVVLGDVQEEILEEVIGLVGMELGSPVNKVRNLGEGDKDHQYCVRRS